MQATFQAFVDAIIPYTPELATLLGSEHAISASSLHVEDYLIWNLNHFIEGKNHNPYSLSEPTAYLLDTSALELLGKAWNYDVPNPHAFPNGGPFTILSPLDRLRAVSLLEEDKLNAAVFPGPYRHNAGLVKYMTALLIEFCLMGYYSEWSGYGSTRLAPPDARKLEYRPRSWKQVGYPGPSFGYTDFRGYEVTKFTE